MKRQVLLIASLLVVLVSNAQDKGKDKNTDGNLKTASTTLDGPINMGGVDLSFYSYGQPVNFAVTAGFWTPDLYISADGVGIGTSSPDAELTVAGTIHAEEVKVDLNVPGDYVFEKYYTGSSKLKADYVMPTLVEVEAFTKKYNHLPEIPSASEIKKDGLHLKEMTNLLLQKIEELTLYTIEQEKRLNAQQLEINKLKNSKQ